LLRMMGVGGAIHLISRMPYESGRHYFNDTCSVMIDV